MTKKEFLDVGTEQTYMIQEKIQGQQICVLLMLKEGLLVCDCA
ncbi:hypothetical protein ACWOFR_14825 [Carnobacterium gallinarum]|nr:hypothetical protein [Carnobacterium gallinarum]